jgi:hypothetical protein
MKNMSINSQRKFTFNDGQQADLLNQGLFLTQIKQLEKVVPAIRERRKKPIPSSRVKEELLKLKKALTVIEKMPQRPAGSEALTRLSHAQMLTQMPTQNPRQTVTLQIFLEAANATKALVDDAISGLPKYRGRIQRSSPRLNGSGEIITLIVGALQRGHAEHCRDLVDRKHLPAFDIQAKRHNNRFTCIVGIVSDVTGGWSLDEAIRAYQNNLKLIAPR